MADAGEESEGEDGSSVTSEIATSRKSEKKSKTAGDGSDEGESEGEEEESEDKESEEDVFEDEEKEDSIDMRDLPSHNEMKRELINAIIQARKEKDELVAQNQEY